MVCLLDTHILLWAISDDKKLRQKHKALIENIDNEIYVSFYSLMEVSIKHSLGKLPEFKAKVDDVIAEIEKANITILSTDVHHLTQYNALPFFAAHRDPFDKFIIACAIVNNLSLLTYDKNFELYKDLVTLL
jgi:PIN domain nuclease of toxin-antitoxin system